MKRSRSLTPKKQFKFSEIQNEENEIERLPKKKRNSLPLMGTSAKISKPATFNKEEFMLHKMNVNEIYNVYGIRRIAFNEDFTLCAVARQNSQIDIWCTAENYKNWLPIHFFPPKKGTSVESIVWVKEKEKHRLFTAGLHGHITEWDLSTFLPKHVSDCYGGAIWAMAKHPTKDLLAVGSEDGRPRIYSLDLELDLSYSFVPNYGSSKNEKNSKNNENGYRIQAITFNNNGDKLICGGFTGVVSYDMKSGRIDFYIPMNQSIVWSLRYLPDDTLVVGDSEGMVYFCDGKFGTVMNKFKEHIKDVLQITSTKSGDTVYCTGIDHLVSVFYKTKDGFFPSQGRRPLSHDSHALTTYKDDSVICGGLCARLSYQSPEKFNSRNKGSFTYFRFGPTRLFAHSSPKTRTILLENNNRGMNLLYIPNNDPNSSNITSQPKVLHKFIAESKGGWGISSSDLSVDGKWIAYCCVDNIEVFEFDGSSVVQAFSPCEYGASPGAHHVKFWSNNHLVIVARDNSIQIFDLNKKKVIQHFRLEDEKIEGTTQCKVNGDLFSQTVFSLDTNAKFLAISYGGCIFFFEKPNDSEQFSIKPKNPYFKIKLDTLAVYSIRIYDHEAIGLITEKSIVRCNLESKNFKLLKLPPVHSNCVGGLRIVVPVGNGSHYIIGNEFQTALGSLKPGEKHVKLISRAPGEPLQSTFAIERISDEKKEFVTLYFNLTEHLASLPPVCYRHRFGT